MNLFLSDVSVSDDEGFVIPQEPICKRPRLETIVSNPVQYRRSTRITSIKLEPLDDDAPAMSLVVKPKKVSGKKRGRPKNITIKPAKLNTVKTENLVVEMAEEMAEDRSHDGLKFVQWLFRPKTETLESSILFGCPAKKVKEIFAKRVLSDGKTQYLVRE